MRRMLSLLALVSLAAACGDDGTSSSSKQTEPDTAATTTEVVADPTTTVAEETTEPSTTETSNQDCAAEMADAIVYAFIDDVPNAEWSLRVVAPDGTDLGGIDTPVQAWLPSWSPDHSYVAFEVATDTASDIGVVACDGTGFKMLTDDGVSGAPAWSPDGSMIAFNSQTDTGRLELIAPDGSDRRVVETGVVVRDSRVAWEQTQDGLFIYFVGAADDGPSDIYMMGQTADPAVFTPGTDAEPSMAPDGHALAFFTNFDPASNASGMDQVWMMTTSDGKIYQIGNSPDGSWQPAWSPNSDQIVYVYNEPGKSSLWLWDEATQQSKPLLVAEPNQGLEGPDWAAG